MNDTLRFDSSCYEIKKCELDGSSILYRAFEGISSFRGDCPIAGIMIWKSCFAGLTVFAKKNEKVERKGWKKEHGTAGSKSGAEQY